MKAAGRVRYCSLPAVEAHIELNECPRCSFFPTAPPVLFLMLLTAELDPAYRLWVIPSWAKRVRMRTYSTN